MATILTITSIGLYCTVCLFFFAMVRAAGWADRTEERKHSDDLARIRRHRRALVESAGRHRRHRAMANGPAGW